MVKIDKLEIPANSNFRESTVQDIIKPNLIIDNQLLRKGFLFLSRSANSEYEDGIRRVPLRSCLLHNNGAVFEWFIKTKPKWLTNLLQTDFDANTGEILSQSVYSTDDLTAGNNRKIKAVNKFCERFKPLYSERKVSMLFYTLTLANQAKTNIRDCLKAFRKRLIRKGIKIHGYVWVLEISDTLHVHYHAMVVIDRINIKGQQMPEFLKLDDLWGANTQVQFVQKNIQAYLAKYFVKNKNRIIGKRQYGVMVADKKQ
jgi:hypothetical protein